MIRIGQRRFNTTGPCFPNEHYMLDPLARLPDIEPCVASGLYFALHAARQAGKTTAMKALSRKFNAAGDIAAMYCSLEGAQSLTDAAAAIRYVSRTILEAARIAPSLAAAVADLRPVADAAPRSDEMGNFVREQVRAICAASGRPVVMVLDEADCLSPSVLVPFLRQLRDGYVSRDEAPFPLSIILVGMRNIRDFRAEIRPGVETLGSASPFNIVQEALSLRNFTEAEVSELYAQHTAATGQAFAPEAIRLAFELSDGQPWIVNAIASECVEKIHRNDFGPITRDDVNAARETLVRRRDTHFDSLLERLKEPRVRTVVDPVIAGDDAMFDVLSDDCQYVLDLGILKCVRGVLTPANPMYSELIGRALTWSAQCRVERLVPDVPWAKADGLDMDWMMREFQRFWRENAESAPEIWGYKESFGHLTLMAFLQRVTNGKGQVRREMALGSGRLDLYVEYGRGRYAIEAKRRKRFTDAELRKTAKYLDALGLSEGFMPVFDTDTTKGWNERIWTQTRVVDGKTIHCYGV